MIENSNPKLIEYNIRFGDPECQIIMMRLKNDLLDLIEASIYKKLISKKITLTYDKAITIVAASIVFCSVSDRVRFLLLVLDISFDFVICFIFKVL